MKIVSGVFKVSFRSVLRLLKGSFMGVSIVFVFFKSSQLPEHMEGLFNFHFVFKMLFVIVRFQLSHLHITRMSLVDAGPSKVMSS